MLRGLVHDVITRHHVELRESNIAPFLEMSNFGCENGAHLFAE
jgi:hypothetical protein